MSRKLTYIISVCIPLLITPRVTAAEIDGFTEPYRTVDIAAHEMGIVTSINFRVGDKVNKGDITATLDDDIHKLLVESARARKEAGGRLASARAEVKLRETRLAKLKVMVARGHGRNEEVDRANADLEIAAANVLVAEDDILLRTLEHRKLVAELERRNVRSPINGVVVQNLKEVGEFVAPADPRVLTVVQLNPLLAKFSLRSARAAHVKIGQKMKVSFANVGGNVEGTVEEISPVIDAESGTVRIKLRVDNADGLLRSGQRCLLQMADIYESGDLDVTTNGPSTTTKQAFPRPKSFQTKSVSDTGREQLQRGQ